MRVALLGGGGVGDDEVVEGALGVEHQRPQLAGPVAVDAGRGAGEALEAEGVGQPLGRVDRDDDRPPPGPRRLEREDRGGGGLADAAGAAADEDAALHRRSSRSVGPAPSHDLRQRLDLGEEPVGELVELGGTELGGEHERQAELGERQLVGQPVDLLVLERHAVAPEGGRRRQRLRLAAPQRGARRLRGRGRGRRRARARRRRGR